MNLIVDACIYENKTQRGIARIFSNTLPLMCDMQPDVKVYLFFRKSPQIAYPNHPRIRTLFLDGVYKLRPSFFWNAHYKKTQDSLIQNLFGWGSHNIWFSTYFTIPSRQWRGKQIVLVHDFIYELFPDYIPGGERVVRQKADAINAADLIICNSQTTYRDLMKIFPTLDKQVFVTHLAADSTFRAKNKEEFGISLDFPFLLYIGKRNGYKNFETLFNAYVDWPGNTTVKLLLVGPNLTEAEINTFQSASVAEKIVVIEHPDDEALCDLYNQALAFVYPSIYEGFGIPLLEAMQCHCPIVASRIPSSLEVAGDVPLYFEATDKISLLDALNKLTDAADLQARAERGIKHARQYSWEKTASEFLKALQTLENWK